MALSDQDKTDLRFFLGYGMQGDDPSSRNMYVKDFSLQLEDRLEHLTVSEENRVKTMLGDLREMEEEFQAARASANIDTAGKFKRNKSELREKRQVYNIRRKELANFLRVPLKG